MVKYRNPDINGDGEVNVIDLSYLSAYWGHLGDHPCDVNRDGIVDGADILFVKKWFGPRPRDEDLPDVPPPPPIIVEPKVEDKGPLEQKEIVTIRIDLTAMPWFKGMDTLEKAFNTDVIPPVSYKAKELGFNYVATTYMVVAEQNKIIVEMHFKAAGTPVALAVLIVWGVFIVAGIIAAGALVSQLTSLVQAQTAEIKAITVQQNLDKLHADFVAGRITVEQYEALSGQVIEWSKAQPAAIDYVPLLLIGGGLVAAVFLLPKLRGKPKEAEAKAEAKL